MEKSKKEFRKKALAKRNQISKWEREKASGEIVKKIVNLPEYIKAKTVLSYHPLEGEVNVREVTKKALDDGKKVYLPKTYGKNERRMDFIRYDNFSQLTKGDFGVMVPEAGELFLGGGAFVIVPGAAFDRKGNRMGYGKGYYDGFFGKQTMLIKAGVCFEGLLYDDIPVDCHDVRMDMVITERTIIS